MKQSYDLVMDWYKKRRGVEFDARDTLEDIHADYIMYLACTDRHLKIKHLCYIVFTCLGSSGQISSKRDVLDESMDTSYSVLEVQAKCMLYPPIYFIPSVIDAMRSGCLDATQGLCLIISYCTVEASTIDVMSATFEKAMLAVCDSKYTESISGEHSEYYVAPDLVLKELLR